MDQNRPITADALVFAPETVVVPISLTVIPRAGYDPAAMDMEIRRRLAVFFGDIDDPELAIIPLGVGKDVMVSQLIAVVMGVPGTYSVDVVAPAADLVIDANQFPELGQVTLVMEAPTNE